MTILAHRRAAGTDGTAPTELVTVDGGKVTPWRKPAPGMSEQRLIEGPSGQRAWYRLPAGASTDLNPDRATLVVDGVDQVPPVKVVDRSWLGEVTERWAAVGHAAWLPDGRIVQAVRVQRRIPWWPLPLSDVWRCVALTPGKTDFTTVTADGVVEPAWHPTVGLVTALGMNGPTVTIPSRGVRFDVPARQSFDPAVSPDGRRVVVLTRDARWGLWLFDWTLGTGRWLVNPADTLVEVTHALWLDDESLVASLKVYGGPVEDRTDASYYSLFRLGLDGSRRRLTSRSDGSVEQPSPVLS